MFSQTKINRNKKHMILVRGHINVHYKYIMYLHHQLNKFYPYYKKLNICKKNNK